MEQEVNKSYPVLTTFFQCLETASRVGEACEDSVRTGRTRAWVLGASGVMSCQKMWSPSFRNRAKNGRKAKERSWEEAILGAKQYSRNLCLARDCLQGLFPHSQLLKQPPLHASRHFCFHDENGQLSWKRRKVPQVGESWLSGSAGLPGLFHLQHLSEKRGGLGRTLGPPAHHELRTLHASRAHALAWIHAARWNPSKLWVWDSLHTSEWVVSASFDGGFRPSL